ncbi:bestrophin family ion channel [soil metagenome]
MWVEDSKSRWFDIIVRSGKVLPQIWPRVLVVVALSVVVTVFYQETKLFHISITPTPFSLIGWPLGIFLGFRNSAAYDRFWEARKLWGSLVNQTRSFARQLLTFVDAPPGLGSRPQLPIDEKNVRGESSVPGEITTDPSLRRELVYRSIAFVHALRHYLRDQSVLDELGPYLPEADILELKDQPNIPVLILQRLAERVADARREGRIHVYHAVLLEQSLQSFTDIQGACERIKSTPIPFSYTVLMHRVVAVYCTLLPFGLADTIHWFTPLVVMFISYAFFGLDAIGDEIEQPFGLDRNDLPLTTISRNIERVLRMQLGEKALPPALLPQNNILN